MTNIAKIPSLLQVFVILLLAVDAVSLTCFEAHAELSDREIFVCDSANLSTEEKLTGQCDPECQSLITSVIDSCQDGDTVDVDFDKVVPYRPAFLFHEFHQNQFTSTWASCDFGYQPTQCDIAYGNLDISRSSIWIFEQIIDNEDACLEELNEDECSPACKAFIDQVVIHCDTPDQVNFSPGDNFFEQTHTVLQWNHVESMTKLHFNPTSDDFAYEPLSEPCWQYYVTEAQEDSPNSIYEPSAPVEPLSGDCRSAFAEVEEAALFGACADEKMCSASCQAIIDAVDDTCAEGDALSVEDTGAYLEYKGSVLYHQFVDDWIAPISSSCQFGKFQPTACDVAYGELVDNLDSLTDEGICSEDFEAGSTTCSPDCRSVIDQIVSDCDVPAGSMFSPGDGYTDGVDIHQVIPWVFPDSMDKSGFNPDTSFIRTLTEPCWAFYLEQGELASSGSTVTKVTESPTAETISSTNSPTLLPTTTPTSSVTPGPTLAPPTVSTSGSPTKAPTSSNETKAPTSSSETKAPTSSSETKAPASNAPVVAPVQPPLARSSTNAETSNAVLSFCFYWLGMVGFVLVLN